MVPLCEAAELTPYSQDHLSLLARNGRLEAVKRGCVWHTTQQALAACQESAGKAAQQRDWIDLIMTRLL